MATSAAAVQEEPATKFAKDQLKAIIERIERLEEEKKTISDDIRDVYAEAKGNGFDVKALRTGYITTDADDEKGWGHSLPQPRACVVMGPRGSRGRQRICGHACELRYVLTSTTRCASRTTGWQASPWRSR